MAVTELFGHHQVPTSAGKDETTVSREGISGNQGKWKAFFQSGNLKLHTSKYCRKPIDLDYHSRTVTERWLL